MTFPTDPTKPQTPCPGCQRNRRECWTLPCLYLEYKLHMGQLEGPRGVLEWLREGGAKLTQEAEQLLASKEKAS